MRKDNTAQLQIPYEARRLWISHRNFICLWGKLSGYGYAMRLWVRYAAMGTLCGYGYAMRLWVRYAAMGTLCGYGYATRMQPQNSALCNKLLFEHSLVYAGSRQVYGAKRTYSPVVCKKFKDRFEQGTIITEKP